MMFCSNFMVEVYEKKRENFFIEFGKNIFTRRKKIILCGSLIGSR